MLVFSATKGYRHESIPMGKEAMVRLGAGHEMLVDTTENPAYFCDDSLKHYSAVVFLSTTGDVLNNYQEAAFERYIQAGGGYVGVHAASDTEYGWGWYGKLVGAYFQSHPAIQDAHLHVEKRHMSTEGLPESWVRRDEWYNFKKQDSTTTTLLTIDEKTYEGGKNGASHPMAWFHDYDGGRAFYTALGHTAESWKEPNFLQHLLGGLRYAIGDDKELDYEAARTANVPAEDRFSRTMLNMGNLFEPTEMTILPNLDALILQRRGEIMRYDHTTQDMEQVGYIPVYWKTQNPKVNAEEGMLGITLDPDFANNGFIYIYHSPEGKSVNRLSRYHYSQGMVEMESERIVLELASDREICCHTGGSLAFGADGLLYLSTGDNTTPFNEPEEAYPSNGYGPTDDRSGHKQYDGRRTSANTNDLRGKILRLKVNPDGSYTAPSGNFFAPGTKGTRPEIYAMGTRNPYRISVDKRRGWVFWGDVGPDASNDDSTRGPKGYDEINVATGPGNFGYPMFIGPNYAYHQHDYGTNENGPAYNPARPVNQSRNNGGITNLPPAKPALIWYPYAVSPDFPELGTGGRNAMAGPVYYPEFYPEGTRMPSYYDGKLFIYDWMRGWIKAVTLNDDGTFSKMEPFMNSSPLNNAIDMEIGPDGRLYVLEYGKGWFSRNPDAALVRLDYNSGNRPPSARLAVDKTSGSLPFTIHARADSSRDPDGGQLTYTWLLGNGAKVDTREPRLTYTYTEPGDYALRVETMDAQKATHMSDPVALYAGNALPKVEVILAGNQSFYFPSRPIQYSVQVADLEEGRLSASAIQPERLMVRKDYMEGDDKAALGHMVVSPQVLGQRLMEASDCKNCHKIAGASSGPAYNLVAARYAGNKEAVDKLAAKVMKGGGGVWGDVAMPAHPVLTSEQARLIVKYVLSLKEGAQPLASLPGAGTVAPLEDAAKPLSYRGNVYLVAEYTDMPPPGRKAQVGGASVRLRSPLMRASLAQKLSGMQEGEYMGHNVINLSGPKGWAAFQAADLSGLQAVRLALYHKAASGSSHTIALHEGGIDGPTLAEATVKASNQASQEAQIIDLPMAVQASHTAKALYLVVSKVDPKAANTLAIETLEVMPK